MAELIQIERHDSVAVLRLHGDGGRFLSAALLQALLTELEKAIADAEVTGIVLAGSQGRFSLGFPLSARTGDPAMPSISDITRLIQDSTKPVVAALQGQVIDEAWELALACDVRVAQNETTAGVVCSAIGILPGAGGTQRLPHIIGVQNALTFYEATKPIPLASPVLQRSVEASGAEDPVLLALAYLQMESLTVLDWRKQRHALREKTNTSDFVTTIAKARQADPETDPLQTRLIDCIEAAFLLPFEAGLAFEATVADDLRNSHHTQALVHLKRAKRHAKLQGFAAPGMAQTLRSVGIVGNGVRALEVAMLCAFNGLQVELFERDEAMVEQATAGLSQLMAVLVPADKVDQIASRVTVSADLSRLADADVVVESVAENISTKGTVLSALDSVLAAETVRVSLSDLLSIDEISRACDVPSEVVGLSFGRTPFSAQAAEILPGEATSDMAISRIAAFCDRIGRTAVFTGTLGGSVNEIMTNALREAAWVLMLQGVDPMQIDRALMAYGFHDGVFKAMDQMGLAILNERMQRLHNAAQLPQTYLVLLDLLNSVGRTGRRAGAGFYQWVENQASPDPELQGLLPDLDGPTLQASDGDIQRNCLAAMANQGAKLLSSGAVLRPSDLDLMLTQIGDFPTHHGGPMKAADQMGLFAIQRELQKNEALSEELYAPDPMIPQLVRNGQSFDSLNWAD